MNQCDVEQQRLQQQNSFSVPPEGYPSKSSLFSCPHIFNLTNLLQDISLTFILKVTASLLYPPSVWFLMTDVITAGAGQHQRLISHWSVIIMPSVRPNTFSLFVTSSMKRGLHICVKSRLIMTTRERLWVCAAVSGFSVFAQHRLIPSFFVFCNNLNPEWSSGLCTTPLCEHQPQRATLNSEARWGWCYTNLEYGSVFMYVKLWTSQQRCSRSSLCRLQQQPGKTYWGLKVVSDGLDLAHGPRFVPVSLQRTCGLSGRVDEGLWRARGSSE